MAGFNTKSNAGPYIGTPGKEQKISQTVHRQPDESSQPIYTEQPEGSQVIVQEQPEGSQVIVQEQPEGSQVIVQEQPEGSQVVYQDSDVIIPLLNFDNLGHNTNYQKQLPPPVHDMQNLTGTNLREAIGVLPDVAMTKYKGAVAIAQDSDLTQGWMEFASVVLYNYVADGENGRWTVDQLKIPAMNNLYEDTNNSDTFYPVIPISVGWKKLQVLSGGTFFATNPIMLPVIKTKVTYSETLNVALHGSGVFPYAYNQPSGTNKGRLTFVMAYTSERKDFFDNAIAQGYKVSEANRYAGESLTVLSTSTAFIANITRLYVVTSSLTTGTGAGYEMDFSYLSSFELNSSLSVSIDSKTYTGRSFMGTLGKNFTAFGGLMMRQCIIPAVSDDTTIIEATKVTWQIKDQSDNGFVVVNGLKFSDITYSTGILSGKDALVVVITTYRNNYFYTYCIITQNNEIDIRFNSDSTYLQLVGLGLYYITDITETDVEAAFPQVTTLSIDGGINYTEYSSSSPAIEDNNTLIAKSSLPYPLDFSETTHIKPYTISGRLCTSYDGSVQGESYKNISLKPYGSYTATIAKKGNDNVKTNIVHGYDYKNDGYDNTKWIAMTRLNLRTITITPPSAEMQFTMAVYADDKWKDYDSTGWYVQDIVGGVDFNIAEESIARSLVSIADPTDYEDEIYDPALLTGKLSRCFSAFLSNSGIDYGYKEVSQSVSSVYDTTDTTKVTHTITAGLGVLSNKGESSETGNVSDIIIEGDSSFSNLNIRRIYRINQIYTLTIVSFTNVELSNEYYFGVINENTLRHYTPVNVKTLSSDITISKIKVHNLADDRFTMTVQTTGEDYYISFSKIQTYPASIFIPDSMKSNYILTVYEISSTTDKIVTDYEVYTDESKLEYGLLAGDTTRKTVGIIEQDDYIYCKNENMFPVELSPNTIVTKPSSLSMPKATGYMLDAIEYAFNIINIPFFCPTYMFGIPGPDSITPSTINNDYQTSLAPLYYRSTQIMTQDYSEHDMPSDIFDCDRSLLVMQLPGWDRLVKNYSLLPEKLSSVLQNEATVDARIGEKSFVINSKSYVHVLDNLYEASISKLIKANNKPLLGVSGTIYVNGNMVCSAGDAGTYIYQMDQYEGLVLVKTITGTMLCAPVSVFDDFAMICDNGIYTLKRDMIHEFDITVEQAIIKPISGYGYLILAEMNEATTYNFMVSDGAGGYQQLVTTDGDNFTFDLDSTTELYQLSNSLSVSKIDRTVISDIDTNYNGIDSDDNSNYLQIYNTTGTADPNEIDSIVYTLGYGAGVTSTYYLETAPIIVQEQNAYQYFDGSMLLIEYEGSATVTAEIIRNTTTDFTSSSEALASTANIASVSLGSMLCNGLKIKLNITPASTAFRILNLKLVGQLQEQNYEVI